MTADRRTDLVNPVCKTSFNHEINCLRGEGGRLKANQLKMIILMIPLGLKCIMTRVYN